MDNLQNNTAISNDTNDIRLLVVMGGFLIALAIIVLLCLFFQFYDYTMDDAFITFRYARNVAEGAGPTFNSGEAPVEGYTSFFWMCIMVLPHLFNADAPAFSKFFGIGCMFGCMALILFWVRKESSEPSRWKWSAAGGAAALLFVAWPVTEFHAITGMETALATFLFTYYCYLSSIASSETPGKALYGLPIVALLFGLTRPEGNLAVLVGLLIVLVCAPAAHRRKLMVSICVLYLIPGIVYFFWRLIYYGHLFPLPFYVKVGGHSGLAGLRVVLAFILYSTTRLGIFIIIASFAFRRRWLPAICGIVTILLFFLFPEHIMGYSQRYLFMLWPTLCIFAGVGIDRILHFLELRVSWPPKLKYFAFTVAIGGLAFYMLTGATPLIRSYSWVAQEDKKTCIVLGNYLLGAVYPGETPPVLAIGDAGAIPYYSKWQTIDTYSLNDPEIILSNRRDIGNIFNRKLDVLVLYSATRLECNPTRTWEIELHRLALERGFLHKKTLPYCLGFYWIFENPNSSIAARLKWDELRY